MPSAPLRPLMLVAFLAAASLLCGCAGPLNYMDPAGPRFGTPVVARNDAPPLPGSDDGELCIVSFNIEFARHVDRAIELLTSDPDLRRADILLLQEMDAPGAEAVARALGMRWVYYPALRHPASGRDFGNAILTRWPILSDSKILLPHAARIGGTRRIAVAANVRVGARVVRVYSLHLATMLGNGPRARREQLAAVLADADRWRHVIIGGDFNSETLPATALPRGYIWPSRDLPATSHRQTLDHLLLKGMGPSESMAAGVVRNNLESSDHRPVWARMRMPFAFSAPPE